MGVNRVQRADGTVELDVTGVTAAAADVAAGKKFVGADGVLTDGAMPSVTQATPSITVSSGGLITASATQSAGKVAAGTKSATKQLTTQGAKTVTPTASEQVAVPAGVFTTGAVTVKGDANLKAANIKKGVLIFGVAGSAVTAGTESAVTGQQSTGSNTNKFVITGLSFSKVKYVVISAVTANTGSYYIASISLHNGKGVVWTYGLSGGCYSETGNSADVFTYSSGVLTVTSSMGTFYKNTPYHYVVIGE